MLSSVIGVVAVVLAWIAIAVITFLLVRFTMRGQQQASEEREAEILAEHGLDPEGLVLTVKSALLETAQRA